MARASKVMAPTSCFAGQVHKLPDAPEAYRAMITRAKAAPARSRSAARGVYSCESNSSVTIARVRPATTAPMMILISGMILFMSNSPHHLFERATSTRSPAFRPTSTGEHKWTAID